MPYFDGRGLKHIRSNLCIWCGQLPPRNKTTTEHFIPRWVLRAFSTPFPPDHNCLTACLSCNNKRGAMPPALFASVRKAHSDTGALAKAHTYWSGVASMFSDSYSRLGPPLLTGFREYVLSDFCALIPKETGIYDHRSDTWPDKIKALCPRSPSQEEWIEIAKGYSHREMASAANATLEKIGAYSDVIPQNPHRERAWAAFKKWESYSN